jgi:hypothetical protein
VKPNVVVAPAANVPLWPSFRTVTAFAVTVSRPFHNCVIVDPLAWVQVTVHEVMVAVPVFRTTTSPWKPPGHELTSLYVPVHVPVPPPPGGVVTVRPGEDADVFPAASLARTVNV